MPFLSTLQLWSLSLRAWMKGLQKDVFDALGVARTPTLCEDLEVFPVSVTRLSPGVRTHSQLQTPHLPW